MTTLALRRPRLPLPLVAGASAVAWLIARLANAALADWASFTDPETLH